MKIENRMQMKSWKQKIVLLASLLATALLAVAPVPARAAPDLLRYNLTVDATSCGNTEDYTGADAYYIAGVFVAVLPDGTKRAYANVTTPFPINDGQWKGYQAVMLDDILPRGTRIYGQMQFYDEDFAKDWNKVSAKFNSAADAGVKAAAATGNPTAAAVAGAAFAAFKVFDAASSADSDDLLGQVGVSIGDSALSQGGNAKIAIKDGKMWYNSNHPAHAGIKIQADATFANKSLINYYSGDVTFTKGGNPFTSYGYTQSWFALIQDPNLDPTTGATSQATLDAKIAEEEKKKQKTAAEVEQWKQEMYEKQKKAAAEHEKWKQQQEEKRKKQVSGPIRIQILETKIVPFEGKIGVVKPPTGQNTLPGRLPGKKPNGTSGATSGGASGRLYKIPGGLGKKIPGGLFGGGATTGTAKGGAQTLPANDGTVISNLPGKLPDGFKFPGTGGGETPGTATPNDQTPNGTETGNVDGGAIEMASVKPVAGSATPIVGKLNQTMAVEIDSNESQDFNLDLPKGQFFVYLDAQRLGEGSLTSSIDASLYLLKRNGAEMPQYGGSLIYWNSRERVSRNGKEFSLSKPAGVRFRVKNDSDGANNFWLTVVPAQPATFLPFGFGFPVKAAKIGSNNGTGSTLEIGEFEYLRATIPAGKWSVSLGARTTGGSCYVSMFSLNARGVDYRDSFSLFGVGKDERKEEIITLAKPTTLIFRVANEGAADTNTISYDVTIEPSTD